MAGAGVKPAIQFPAEDELEDCPEAVPPCSSSVVEGPAAASAVGKQIDSVVKGVAAIKIEANGHGVDSEEDGSGDSDEDDDDEICNGTEGESGDAWKLEDGKGISCACLVCDFTASGYEAAELIKQHLETAHNLNFAQLQSTYNLGYTGFVQFVRWAREQKALGLMDSGSMSNVWTSCRVDPPPWSLDKYLLPSQSDSETSSVDYLLTLDYFAKEDKPSVGSGSDNGAVAVDALVSEIERLQQDKQRMAAVFQRIVTNNVDEDLSSLRQPSPNSINKLSPKKRNKAWKTSPGQSVSTDGEDQSNNHNKMYFESYDEISIHHDMIFDHSRTEAYRKAIVDRAPDMRGKVVMDLGCGTGILSMFCAQQGAKVVHAVDKSNIIFDAISNSFENNFENVIKFHHKDLDNDDTSDLEKVDVLVSEFMGYFLFFEGMTESFIRAREKFLKPDGVVMPDRCIIELAPMGPTGLYQSRIGCWDAVYGFKMPVMKIKAVKEPLINTVTPDEIIGYPVQVKELDLLTCDVDDVYISKDFEFEFKMDSEFCAVAGYFSVDFNGPSKTITLGTSPWNTPTHWKQTVFFFPQPFNVTKGQKLKGFIRSCKHKDDPRWLYVLLSFGDDKKFMYEIK